MRLGMEILSRASYIPNSNWLLEESRSTKWTPAENKIFENALALYDKDTPDRWQKVAAMIPGKTVVDVMKQYKELEDDVSSIEAGLMDSTPPFTLEWGHSNGFKQPYSSGGKRFPSTRSSEQERKKGVPWTEEEHKLFLMGLKKYGKGDWRNISRNFVITRTPTQVASHAQKYFIRQLSGGKDKRRASIHDITTVNLNDNQTPLPDNKRASSPEQSTGHSHQQQPNSASLARTNFQWNKSNNGATMPFNTTHGNMFMSNNPYGINSYGLKMQSPRSALHESYIGSQNMVFQMPAQHYPYG
uniref:Putative transcription factor DIVARICATA n=1 Tax=Davidia involucrata TaxID=16924 RepID=A0A5B7ASN4_DAVIN